MRKKTSIQEGHYHMRNDMKKMLLFIVSALCLLISSMPAYAAWIYSFDKKTQEAGNEPDTGKENKDIPDSISNESKVAKKKKGLVKKAPSLTASQVVSFLETDMANHTKDYGAYLCLKYVSDVYKKMGFNTRYNLQTAKIYWNILVNEGKAHNQSLDYVPVGADVFFDLQSGGHVGIYVGNGCMIHNSTQSDTDYGVVRTCFSNNPYYMNTYLGWAWHDWDVYVIPDGSTTNPPVPDGDYVIATAQDPRYYLDINGAAISAPNNENVEVAGPADHDAVADFDVWHVEYISSENAYKICQKTSRTMCLDVKDASLEYNAGTEVGANVQVYKCEGNGGSNQRWIIKPNGTSNGNNVYLIQPQHGGGTRSLDIFKNQYTTPGINVQSYLTDGTQAQKWVLFPYTSKDTEKPVLSNCKISNVSFKGYTVSCNVSDNVGVTSVTFYTWTAKTDAGGNDQDDITSHTVVPSNGVVTDTINIADHNNERGLYYTHIYAYDAAGNEGFSGVGAWIPAAVNGSSMSVGYDRVLPDGDYIIAATENPIVGPENSPLYYLDIVGSGIAEPGTNVQLWYENYDSVQNDDVWTITYNSSDKFYTIKQKNSNICLDVAEGSTENGANVWAATCHGGANQKWAISRNGTNGYRIQPQHSGGGSTPMSMEIYNSDYTGGANIWMAQNNNTNAQSWVFIPYKPSQPIAEGRYVLLYTPDTSYELDVASHSANVPDQTNVQIWNSSSTPSRYNSFNLIKLSNGYYKVKQAASGKCLEVYGASRDYNSNVNVLTDNGSVAQQWAIVSNDSGYSLISRVNGYALNLPNGTGNGKNVTVYPRQWNNQQRWSFVKAEYNVDYIVAQGTASYTFVQKKYYKEDLTLSNTIPTREGYVFKNWNTKADGTGTSYEPEAKYTTDADLTLYVQWTPLVSAVTIKNSSGADITGKTVTTKDKTNQLKAVAAPSGAAQEFTWASSSTSVATVDANGKVTFKIAGTVKITATTTDGSNKSASVTLKYVPLATSVTIENSSGTDITGKTVTTKDKTNQLKAVAAPEGAEQKFTWASSSTDIASVDANGKVTFKIAGSVKITATASDGSKKSASVTLKYVPLATSVTIENSSGTDITGKTVTTKDKANQLKAVAAPSGAAQKFTWKSSDTNTATVDENGKVTFKKAGSVKITATASDGSKKSASVTLKYVPLAASVKIQNSSGKDITGQTIEINTATYQLKAAASPADAVQKFTWSSSSTGIATVDANGKVTFKKAGAVTITATASDGSRKSASVTLKYVPLATSVTIENSSGTDITGKTMTVNAASYQLKAVAVPSGAAQKFTWKSSDTNTATVDANGKVTFKKAGSVKITATASDGSKKSASVTLKYVPLATSVTIQDSSGTDITGKTVTTKDKTNQLKAVAAPSGAAQEFTWASSDTNTATVDANGKVTFKKAGAVTITATASDGSRKSASVTLKYVPLTTSVTIENSSGTDITGKTVTVNAASYQLKAVAAPSGSAQKFTWKSSSTGVATVDANGKVTFQKAGSVKITATASDGSKKAASVTLKYSPQKPVLEIKDTNIRGKNKEIQIVVPWSEDLIKVECTLYDDSTGKEVKPTFRERMDATGKNRVVSYVGSPLENGNVYRFKLRVYNGQWSNYVEKYAMPIPNVYGATVVAGNQTMNINNQHREPTTGTRYMLFDAATGLEFANKLGTKTNTTWKYNGLENGKLYYVVAVPYRDYKEQRLWGPNENRIYFIPMGIPSNGKVSFSGTNATVSITADSSVDGIRVLYRLAGGNLQNGCEAKGAKCTITGMNSSLAYEFYAMKYKIAEGKTYYSTGTLIPYKTDASGLTAPQMNPVVAMNNSGYTTFTIRKSSNAEGISVLYKIGNENFQQACEAAGNSCSTTLDISKNYTFYIMQYKTVNGKKVYSPGIVARDFSSMKNGEFERMYTGFMLADGRIDMNEIYAALDGYMSEESLLMAEALALISEDMVSKDVESFYEDFDYSGFDSETPYEDYEDLYDASGPIEYGGKSEEPFNREEPTPDEEDEVYLYRFGEDAPVNPTVPSFNN